MNLRVFLGTSLLIFSWLSVFVFAPLPFFPLFLSHSFSFMFTLFFSSQIGFARRVYFGIYIICVPFQARRTSLYYAGSSVCSMFPYLGVTEKRKVLCKFDAAGSGVTN